MVTAVCRGEPSSRSKHSLIARKSPPLASSTSCLAINAAEVSPLESVSSMSRRSSVTIDPEPTGRPAGLPLVPATHRPLVSRSLVSSCWITLDDMPCILMWRQCAQCAYALAVSFDHTSAPTSSSTSASRPPPIPHNACVRQCASAAMDACFAWLDACTACWAASSACSSSLLINLQKRHRLGGTRMAGKSHVTSTATSKSFKSLVSQPLGFLSPERCAVARSVG